ncbi:TerC family protein [Pseudoclavibacter caeni]|jgi:tellurite resistance protein TerC|uniref:TerC family protein n=1 Tax=Pseudoclavibacter caeni TaxID=908846 RepID=A0A7C8BNL0_9MICO|nr:TerC family protein [Pseudoclavibacter caeni]KAB1632340.1 TerC family protein [Pseudoclavibacter caeni]NYJ97581.1 tellurite resistance protein TerC [Pseudoclavibacter caeni]
MQPLPVAFEIGSTIALLLVLVFDILLVVKRPHVPSMKEASLWVGFYVALALAFAGVLFVIGDATHGSEFIAGWLTEYSLSIDNLFVFVIIMSRFGVPRRYQQEVLMFGILVALALRGVFILLGAQILERWSFVFYLFGAYLVYTAIKQAFGSEDEGEGEDNGFIRMLRRRVRMTDQFDGSRLRTTIDGQRYWTPMLMVFLAIGTTDLLFAFDSIPAIFGITQNAFLVFATNVFALMGLRQLYFLLGGLLDKLEYLKYGIAFILGFIGVKLVLHAMHVNELPFVNGGEPIAWAPDISTVASLVVIVASMGVATVASLIKVRRDRLAAGEDLPHPGAAER